MIKKNKVLFVLFLFSTISSVNAIDFELENKEKKLNNIISELDKQIQETERKINAFNTEEKQKLITKIEALEKEINTIIVNKLEKDKKIDANSVKGKLEKITLKYFSKKHNQNKLNKGNLLLINPEKAPSFFKKEKLKDFYKKQNDLEKLELLHYDSEKLKKAIKDYKENKKKYDDLFASLEEKDFDYSEEEDLNKLIHLFLLTETINEYQKEELEKFLNIKSYFYEIAYKYKKSNSDKNIETYLDISKEYNISQETLSDILDFYKEEKNPNYREKINLKVLPKNLISEIKEFFLSFLKEK